MDALTEPQGNEAQPEGTHQSATPAGTGDVGLGLDWPLIFPAGPRREKLVRVLRLLLVETADEPGG